MSVAADLARGVVMAGISGTAFDSALPRFGGFLLFGSDEASLGAIRSLTDELRLRGGDPPPVIAIDQEGGSVARLRHGVEPMPSMMAVGAADDIELTGRAGEQVAFDLRRAGCTLDFAPVLDLALDSQNFVIGTRSIGADPARVASLGAAFAAGMIRGGLLPCYKHFPGHGATPDDSHKVLPVVDVDEATIRARDLVPFAQVAAGAPAMMTAHVLVRAFDSDRPATLSPRIAFHLLRDELGFRGALVTDCLEMGAVANGGSSRRAVEALAAGADLLLFSHDLDLAAGAVAEIEAAVDLGRIPFERLQAAHSRVMALRLAAAAPIAVDAFPPHPGVGREIARRAITLLRGVPHADPGTSIAVSFGSSSATLHREAPALDELLVSLDPGATETESIVERLARRGRRPLLLARRAHRYGGQAAAIAQILDRYPDALVVSMLEPFDLPLFSSARHLLAAYGDDVASIGGLADTIFGGSMPVGRLPI